LLLLEVGGWSGQNPKAATVGERHARRGRRRSAAAPLTSGEVVGRQEQVRLVWTTTGRGAVARLRQGVNVYQYCASRGRRRDTEQVCTVATNGTRRARGREVEERVVPK
jgi:hypothetical protein